MCSDPNVLAVALCVLVILVCCIAAGFMGMGVSGAGAKSAQRLTANSRRIHPMVRAGWILSALSVVFTVIAAPALGAAFLAGLGTGVWSSTDELAATWRLDRRFEPAADEGDRDPAYRRWRTAVDRAKGWA